MQCLIANMTSESVRYWAIQSSGHRYMRNDSEYVLSDADLESGGSPRATAKPPRKTWVSPKVITSTMVADAAHASNSGSDGNGSSTIS